MPFQLSPGVVVTEQDLTTVVPAVATSAGAFAGDFSWGPAEVPILIDSENKLVATFGKPSPTNSNAAATFFTAANFLSYGNQLWVTRAIGAATAKNAVANVAAATPATAQLVKNIDDYQQKASYDANVFVVAKFPGNIGNSLRVSIADGNVYGTWQYKDQFTAAPNTSSAASNWGSSGDEFHMIVIDEDGAISGSKNTVLEKFAFMSKAVDAKAADGTSIYYKNIVNNSKYLWAYSDPTASGAGTVNWGSTVQSAGQFKQLTANLTISMVGGLDAGPSDAEVQSAYLLYKNADQYDISLIPTGVANAATITSVINNLAESRQDCVAFFSPPLSSVQANTTAALTNVVNFRTASMANLSSSYAVMDSGWKYQYDRYNDIYRWVPLNGDIAGLCARTDFVSDPWFSPAGLNRGQIKNVVKLAYNPSKADRDVLYNNGINPVISSVGQGTVLFGDKTLLSKPSAFDRINVRRLFIVLEKAISTASRYQLFEFNDPFTRAQFRNLVEPFLRDVKGRRGITDFKVVCDETNNTGEVIDRNEFVADIYIKPARSINYITLNFVATRTGVSFTQVAG